MVCPNEKTFADPAALQNLNYLVDIYYRRRNWHLLSIVFCLLIATMAGSNFLLAVATLSLLYLLVATNHKDPSKSRSILWIVAVATIIYTAYSSIIFSNSIFGKWSVLFLSIDAFVFAFTMILFREIRNIPNSASLAKDIVKHMEACVIAVLQCTTEDITKYDHLPYHAIHMYGEFCKHCPSNIPPKLKSIIKKNFADKVK